MTDQVERDAERPSLKPLISIADNGDVFVEWVTMQGRRGVVIGAESSWYAVEGRESACASDSGDVAVPEIDRLRSALDAETKRAEEAERERDALRADRDEQKRQNEHGTWVVDSAIDALPGDEADEILIGPDGPLGLVDSIAALTADWQRLRAERVQVADAIDHTVAALRRIFEHQPPAVRASATIAIDPISRLARALREKGTP